MGGDARRFTSSVRGLLLRLWALFDVVVVAVAPLSWRNGIVEDLGRGPLTWGHEDFADDSNWSLPPARGVASPRTANGWVQGRTAVAN
jgi:hypothetical protein